MKRLLGILALVALTAPAAWAGEPIPVGSTILTDRVPPYVFPAAGNPVPIGGSATNTVLLTKGEGVSQISLIGLVPGSDFEITGGTCVQNVTVLADPGDDCTVDIRFTPTAAGARSGLLNVDCTPVEAVGGITIICDVSGSTVVGLALSGVGLLLESLAVPALGRYELTALALLLFALAAWSLRRKA